jgi:hypothetical protein
MVKVTYRTSVVSTHLGDSLEAIMHHSPIRLIVRRSAIRKALKERQGILDAIRALSQEDDNVAARASIYMPSFPHELLGCSGAANGGGSIFWKLEELSVQLSS